MSVIAGCHTGPRPAPEPARGGEGDGDDLPGRAVTVVTTALLAVASAVVPVVNLEVALLGVAAASRAPEWVLALTAAVGQVAGKTLYYLVGSGVIARVPGLRRRAGAPRPPSVRRARWALRLAAVQAWAVARPWGPGALTFASALTGLPPFAVTSLLAGTLRMPLWLFWATGVAGRFLRFLAVLGAGSRAAEWLVG
jgi:membrane protein YqaA with SNARE-associated domain